MGSLACWIWGWAAQLTGFAFIHGDSSGWGRAERALSTTLGTIKEKASPRGISPRAGRVGLEPRQQEKSQLWSLPEERGCVRGEPAACRWWSRRGRGRQELAA